MNLSDWIDSQTRNDLICLKVSRSNEAAFNAALKTNPSQPLFLPTESHFANWNCDTIFFVMHKTCQGWLWTGSSRVLLERYFSWLDFSNFPGRVALTGDLADILFEE